ncbi:TPA: RNA-binding protein [Candidatus Woesearchaeota archaeon]|nr:MAG: hypothetical protein QT04_C0047G0015 [archaeon GW2011_AR11]MBS3110745.1 RNA-binding protein [Candidatus Woesearchaeota archaeon]HII64667.1 RNA-binding protein [Candidatus Woesearchaeota archaeon]HII65617.1 RNA-binding protein [Candidatus Woesearchaeota archaeon]HIJ18917.1 RNA-binding protein [Candidatus Woesearchaeota archaeon]
MEKILDSASRKRITNTVGTARFKCPACGKHEIVRTRHMRQIAAKYACPGCGFEGPN